jgi:hypothetical protein
MAAWKHKRSAGGYGRICRETLPQLTWELWGKLAITIHTKSISPRFVFAHDVFVFAPIFALLKRKYRFSFNEFYCCNLRGNGGRIKAIFPEFSSFGMRGQHSHGSLREKAVLREFKEKRIFWSKLKSKL